MTPQTAEIKLKEAFLQEEKRLLLGASNARNLGIQGLLRAVPESIEIQAVYIFSPWPHEERFTIAIDVNDEASAHKVKDAIFKGDAWKIKVVKKRNEFRARLAVDRISRRGGQLHKVEMPVEFVISFKALEAAHEIAKK